MLHYLIERGLVTCESVVDGGVEISEVSRRNRNFRVRQQNGSNYFIKQVRRWEPEAVRTLQVEAQCYQLAAENGAFSDIPAFLPDSSYLKRGNQSAD